MTYALNMYFQSYGAVSIIKVKAHWFHVRERGMFGAIFGTLISFGVYFAFDWGQAIIDITKLNAPMPTSAVERLLRAIFVPPGLTMDATWAVFFVPAAILAVWALLDIWLIRDTPEHAGFPHLDTHDASSGHMHEEYSAFDLLKMVFLNPLIVMFAFVELTAGVLRNGIMQWYTIFAHDVKQPGAEIILSNWGLHLCVFGIVGGFVFRRMIVVIVLGAAVTARALRFDGTAVLWRPAPWPWRPACCRSPGLHSDSYQLTPPPLGGAQ